MGFPGPKGAAVSNVSHLPHNLFDLSVHEYFSQWSTEG